ncbi:MAG: hypothetical protein GXY44_00970 [Phycisphaerales bacterium]|nr:hypothetical protein [Phycisphaerales bacterium]
MPRMYQLNSTQRPGRPHWALAATAILLLLTVLMAYALIGYKKSTHAIELAEEVVYHDARIKARVPVGWTENPDNKPLPKGAVAVFTEPTGSNRSGGRTIILFRGRPSNVGLPSSHLPGSIVQWIKALDLRGQIEFTEPTSESIGPLPGITQIGLLKTVVPATRQQILRHIIGRAAMAPGGQTFGLLMFSQNPSIQADLRLVAQISAHLQITDVEIADGPDTAMLNAGINFPIPARAIYLKETEPGIPRVRIMDGQRKTSWFLDLYRIPLPEPQTPERVVTNAALNLLETAALPHSPQSPTKEVGREACQLTLPIPGNVDARIELWCIRTDQYTGLVLKGRCERNAENELKALCRTIATQAVVESYSEIVSTGQLNARLYLKQIADQGLSAWWKDVHNTTMMYLAGSPALVFGQQAVKYGTQQREASTWWDIEDHTIDFGHQPPFQLRQTWVIREDVSTYALRIQDTRVQYAEFLEPEQNEVRSELITADSPSLKRSTRVSNTFGCEPVLILAGSLLATDTPEKHAMFTSKETFSPYLSGWWMTSLGIRPLPVGQSAARAVRLQLDSSPEPLTLYYNEDNSLLAVALDNGIWRQRSDLINNNRQLEQDWSDPR